MAKTKPSQPSQPVRISGSMRLAMLAGRDDVTPGELHGAITETIEQILSDDDGALRQVGLFILLQVLHDCDSNGRCLTGRAASIIYSYTDLAVKAQEMTMRQWGRAPDGAERHARR